MYVHFPFLVATYNDPNGIYERTFYHIHKKRYKLYAQLVLMLRLLLHLFINAGNLVVIPVVIMAPRYLLT